MELRLLLDNEAPSVRSQFPTDDVSNIDRRDNLEQYSEYVGALVGSACPKLTVVRVWDTGRMGIAHYGGGVSVTWELKKWREGNERDRRMIGLAS